MGKFGHLLRGQNRIKGFTRSNITPNPLLLDKYTRATFCYSTKLKSINYFGPCMKVRRSSDNTTQDFYFVNNDLDTISLLTFCGVGNGFVDTWYDQSGNGYHMTQATTGSQPQIVASGVVNFQNGLYYLDFDGTDDYVANGSITVNTGFFFLFINAKLDSATASQVIIGANNNFCSLQQLTNAHYTYAGSSAYGYYSVTDITSLLTKSSFFNGSLTGNSERLKAYQFGIQQTLTFSGTVPTTVSGTGLTIGRVHGSAVAYFNGRITDVCGWDSYVPNEIMGAVL